MADDVGKLLRYIGRHYLARQEAIGIDFVSVVDYGYYTTQGTPSTTVARPSSDRPPAHNSSSSRCWFIRFRYASSLNPYCDPKTARAVPPGGLSAIVNITNAQQEDHYDDWNEGKITLATAPDEVWTFR